MIVCPNCNQHPAVQTQFGIMPCEECKLRIRGKITLTQPLEFTTESIKEERKRFAKDIIQPFRAGQLSKEYVEAWGTQHLNVSKEEVKNAKNVWSENHYYD